MEMLFTDCPICNSREDYTVIYRDNFEIADLNPDTFSARRLPDFVHYQIVRCKNDGLVRSTPVFSRDMIERLYRESRFTYAEQIDNLTATYLDALNKVLPVLPKDAKMLEVGCGNGFLLKTLLDKGYVDICGIEPSLAAVSKADNRIKRKITVDFLRDGIYKNNQFNFIFSFQTFDHMYEPVNFIKTCFNLLLPGGFILILSHDLESLSAKILKERSPIIDIEHPFLYSKLTIRKLFEKNGFKTLKVYSPKSLISIRYLIWLFPFLKILKTALLGSKSSILNLLLNAKMKVDLGNLCLIARKPPY